MRSYERFLIAVKDEQGASPVSHRFTFRLNSSIRRVEGLFIVGAHPFNVDTPYQIGVKFNEVEILPREFHAALMTHNTQVPLRDVIQETPFDGVSGESIIVDVTVEQITTPQHPACREHTYLAYLYVVTEV